MPGPPEQAWQHEGRARAATVRHEVFDGRQPADVGEEEGELVVREVSVEALVPDEERYVGVVARLVELVDEDARSVRDDLEAVEEDAAEVPSPCGPILCARPRP